MCIVEHNPLNPLTRPAVRRCSFDADAVLLRAGTIARLLRGAGASEVKTEFFLTLPTRHRLARGIEPVLGRLPFGAQYLARRGRCRAPPGARGHQNDRSRCEQEYRPWRRGRSRAAGPKNLSRTAPRFHSATRSRRTDWSCRKTWAGCRALCRKGLAGHARMEGETDRLARLGALSPGVEAHRPATT
jgi:hypothetical protein